MSADHLHLSHAGKFHIPAAKTIKATISEHSAKLVHYLSEYFKYTDPKKLLELKDAIAVANENLNLLLAEKSGQFHAAENIAALCIKVRAAVTAARALQLAEAANFHRKVGLGVASAAVVLRLLIKWAKSKGYFSNDEDAAEFEAQMLRDASEFDDSEY